MIEVLALSSAAFGTTWYIKPDGTGDAPTIQAGVDAASAGDIVLVAAGTYPTTSMVDIDGTLRAVCVAIDKDIDLLSESGAASTTIGSATAAVAIYVHDVVGSVEISGFRVQTSVEGGYICLDDPTQRALGEIFPSSYTRGIKCRDAEVSIQNNLISENEIGVELIASSATLAGNTVSAALECGVAGLESTNAVITGNTIHSCAILIFFLESTAIVSHNDIYDGCIGFAGGPATISDNEFREIEVTAVHCSGAVTVQNNRFNPGASFINTGVDVTGAFGTTPVVRGNLFVRHANAIKVREGRSAIVESNTIDQALIGIDCYSGSSPVIRRNIIVGSGSGVQCSLNSSPIIECNDVFTTQGRYVGHCADQTGINGNISIDPQFCGEVGSGNYFLQGDSPCAPGNHPNGYACDLIGALPVGCGAVLTREATWGSIKAMYRK